MIKYNEKYDRWVSKDGLVYMYSKGQDKLVLCKLTSTHNGYLRVNVPKPKTAKVRVNRLVYETFVGEIPQGYEIDHINTIKTDNRLENLRCVTRKENASSPLTRKHKSEAHKGKIHSEETKRKMSKAHKGKHWHIENGKRVWGIKVVSQT